MRRSTFSQERMRREMKSLGVVSTILLSLILSPGAQDNADNVARCGGVPGVPGSPGSSGTPGRDGRDGRDGVIGDKGEHGAKGERGLSGALGGVGGEGPAGVKGDKGVVGAKGDGGKLGPRGPKGDLGLRGSKGDIGGKGDKGEQSQQINWKQCVWKRHDGKDTGLIQECRFKKRHGHTALHVAYAGTLRVYCPGSSCCSRWFFTFNDRECTGPMAIDGVVYMSRSNDDPHRHRQIEGYCENIPAGEIKIGFNIGKCNGYSVGDGYSGWTSVSRVMVAEMPPAQQ